MGHNENSYTVFRVAAFVISTALSIGGILVAGRPHLEPRKTDHRLEVRGTGDGGIACSRRCRMAHDITNFSRRALMEPIRKEKLPRRNAKCPCSSGKKAKKCCLNKIKALAALPPVLREQVVSAKILGHPVIL